MFSKKKKLSLELNSVTPELIMSRFRFYFSHLAMLVHVVVRQLHFLERNNLFSQLLAGEG